MLNLYSKLDFVGRIKKKHAVWIFDVFSNAPAKFFSFLKESNSLWNKYKVFVGSTMWKIFAVISDNFNNLTLIF